MIQIRRILCPVDLSEFSRHALEHAALLARWYDSELVVLHVYAIQTTPALAGGPEPLVVPVALPPPGELRQQAVDSLARFTAGLVAAGAAVRCEVEAGDPRRAILAAAASLPADLLVLGTHGRSGFDRLVLGSVTEKVLRKAACPVLTVPPPVTGTAGAPVLFKRILCPVDFSESSMNALGYALSLAQESDATLLLMHVVESFPSPDPEVLPDLDFSAYERSLAASARERLAAAVPDEARSWCTPEVLVTSGKPYRQILEAVEQRDVHLIVMGVKGRNPLDLMLFGSTTQHIVRQAPCPVLTLRE